VAKLFGGKNKQSSRKREG